MDTRTAPSSPLTPPPVSRPIRYRPEIDGLRAIAVFAVVLTHLRVPGLAGGFIGVDVFFVISGYLIYADLTLKRREGRFSLLGFYGRRVRRTLPALYLVLAVTLGVACLLLLPGDLVNAARSATAAVLVVPNIFFLSQAGYFDGAAAMKPLLHTWSLGVEEQFYLLCPLLTWTMRGWRARTRLLLLAALFGVTLAGSALAWRANPSAAFYLMPTRIWEFVIGCVLAERVVPRVRIRWLAEAVAAVALLALLASIHLFSETTPHPALPTLVPCLATAAIIHVAESGETGVGRLLSLRPLVFVGLISYSLYLWHWPLIVFARVADVPFTPLTETLAVVLLVGVSALSWRYVETPFRVPGSPWRRRAPVVLAPGAAALLAAGIGLVATRGLPHRWPADVAAVADYYDYAERAPFREGTCFITSKESLSDYKPQICLRLDPARHNVLLIGDSHAAHLWQGLSDTFPDANVLQATASGCKPVLDPVGAARCTGLMGDMLRNFVPKHHLDAIVIAALWDEADLPALRRTVAYLKLLAGTVYVIGPMPRYNQPLSSLLAESLARHNSALPVAHRLASVPPLDRHMQAEIGPLTPYISAYQAMCPADTCRLYAAPGVPMQFDYHHLTKQGADWLVEALKGEGLKL